MRVVVLGAGAVGGVVGARLFEAGHDVVLVARGAHLDAMRQGGLRVESPGGAVTLAIPVVGSPAAVPWAGGEVVLVATKTQDTAAALAALAEAVPPTTPVVCVQNGVENERLALRRFAAVYGACVMVPAAHLAPGVVQAFGAPATGILDVGRYPSGTDATAEEVAAAFRSATFESVARPDVMRWKHGKLLTNLGNAVEAACGPAARGGELYARARAEGEACLRAAGIEFVGEEEDLARRGDLLSMRRVGGEHRGGGSTWQSLARATGTVETDWLNGEIVLLGRLHGVPTPVNALLQQVAAELARAGAPPASLSPDDLLARLPTGR